MLVFPRSFLPRSNGRGSCPFVRWGCAVSRQHAPTQFPRRPVGSPLSLFAPPPSRGGLRQLNATPPTTRLPPSHVQFTSALPLSSALRFNRRPRRVDLLASASAGTAAATGVGRAVCYVPGGRRKAATWRNTHAPPPPSLPATRLRRVRASIHTTAAVAVSAAAAVAAAWWRGASVSLFPHHPRPGGAACWGCAPVSRAVATCVMRDDGRRVHRRAIMDDAATLPPTPPPRLVVLQDVATPPPPTPPRSDSRPPGCVDGKRTRRSPRPASPRAPRTRRGSPPPRGSHLVGGARRRRRRPGQPTPHAITRRPAAAHPESHVPRGREAARTACRVAATRRPMPALSRRGRDRRDAVASPAAGGHGGGGREPLVAGADGGG